MESLLPLRFCASIPRCSRKVNRGAAFGVPNCGLHENENNLAHSAARQLGKRLYELPAASNIRAFWLAAVYDAPVRRGYEFRRFCGVEWGCDIKESPRAHIGLGGEKWL
jgi:hypothetical protein